MYVVKRANDSSILYSGWFPKGPDFPGEKVMGLLRDGDDSLTPIEWLYGYGAGPTPCTSMPTSVGRRCPSHRGCAGPSEAGATLTASVGYWSAR